MTKIKGHTVGSDGIVYNPDTASFGYISSMDSRVENNHSDERGTLVTDQGRHVPISNPAAGQVQTAPGGGGSGPGAAVVATGGAQSAGSGAGSQLVGTGPLKPKLKPTHTQLMIGSTGWTHDPGWSDTAEWEERYGEPGDWIGGIALFGVDIVNNVQRWAGETDLAGAIPSAQYEAQPRFHEGWMTYDEGMTWEPIREMGNPATWSTGTGRNPHSRTITGGGF